MPIQNLDWYAFTATVDYPLDERATCVSDGGVRLPQGVLADLSLRYPRELGDYPFLGAVSVTPRLATVVIEVATAFDPPGVVTPLAAVSVPLPVDEGRHYALRPMSPGVGGWAVFAEGVRDVPYSGRFRSPKQSLLAARAAKGYRKPPVTSLGVFGEQASLAGVVRLRGEPPVAVDRAQRHIRGQDRDVVLVHLVQPDTTGGFQAADAAGLSTIQVIPESVFEQFAGPCSG